MIGLKKTLLSGNFKQLIGDSVELLYKHNKNMLGGSCLPSYLKNKDIQKLVQEEIY